MTTIWHEACFNTDQKVSKSGITDYLDDTYR